MAYTKFWNNGISQFAEGKLLQDALANKGNSESALRRFEFHLAGDHRG